MDIKQLKFFQTVAEYENISRAAEKLYISQPALTKSIHQLESELNAELFDRNGKQIHLNAVGQTTLRYANCILKLIELMQATLEKMPCEENRLTLYTTQSTIARYVLPEFSMRNPDTPISYQMDQFEDYEFLQMLLDGVCDIAISSAPFNDEQVESVYLFEEHICLCIPQSSPFAQRDCVQIEELQELTFPVTQEKSFTSYHRYLMDFLRSHGAVFKEVIVPDFASINYLKNTTDICTLVSDVEWKYNVYPNRKIIKIKGGIAANKSYICYLKKEKERVAATVGYLLDELAKI